MTEYVLLQSANETLNASNSVTSGFGDTSGLVGLTFLLAIYAVVALLAANLVAPWLAQSAIFGRIGAAISSALAYAIKGVATTAVLGALALPAYLFATADAATRSTGLEYAGYAVGGFLILVGIGQLADKAVSRFIDAHPDHDSWEDIWGDGTVDVPDEELQDVATDD